MVCGAMNHKKSLSHLVLLLAFLLGLGAFAYLSKGFSVAWQGGDSDLCIREREWSDFKQGIYPNVRFTPEGKPPAKTHSVYPPYALSMYAVFFGPGGFLTARVILQVFSLGGLMAMAWQGYRTLGMAGWQAALLGAMMGPAISGNCSAIALGQFSIICAGFLSLQVFAIQANREVLAGICWALAMIKPQIALPFALLFVLQRQWRGLFSGAALLAFLSAGAFWWTGWSPWDFFHQSLATEKLLFIRNTGFSGTGWMDWFDLPPRAALAIAFVLIATAGGVVLLYDWRSKVSLLNGAGLSAMLGFVLFYHRQYDNQMLFLLILAAAARVLQNGWRALDMIVCGLLGLTLYLPAGMVAGSRALSFLAFVAPVAAAVLVLMPARRPAESVPPVQA